MTEILFCRENLDKYGEEVLLRLQAENRPDQRVQVVKCLHACGECGTALIARKNGELITAETVDQLLQLLCQ